MPAADVRCIGVMGGTFDPIHYGHLRTALELRERLALDHVRFIPCHDPPTPKRPLLNPATRLRIVQAATESEPGFVVDAREIERGGVSYTVDTLRSLRADFASTPIALIMGMDAFVSLPEWREWRSFVEFAHIVVARRPGWHAPGEGVLGALLRERGSTTVQALHGQPAGLVHVAQVTQLEISSTALRESISRGIDPKFLVPPAVRSIVLEMECYAGTATPEQ